MSLKLAGELGDEAPNELKGVCAVSPAIDLAACAAAIQKRSNWLYNQRFVTSLKAKMRRINKLNPARYDLEKLAAVRTIRDFDTHFTAVYHGFNDTADYYNRSSALGVAAQIQLPTLIIQARNDPFVPFEAFEHPAIKNNPNIILLAPASGGHVGFVARRAARDKNRFWAENRLIQFCDLLAEHN